MQEIDDRLLIRYYSRIIEAGIKKVSYFWHNSSKLNFLYSAMVQFIHQIHIIVNEINNIKNLQYHINILRLLFAENSLIEEKIYQLLIN